MKQIKQLTVIGRIIVWISLIVMLIPAIYWLFYLLIHPFIEIYNYVKVAL